MLVISYRWCLFLTDKIYSFREIFKYWSYHSLRIVWDPHGTQGNILAAKPPLWGRDYPSPRLALRLGQVHGSPRPCSTYNDPSKVGHCLTSTGPRGLPFVGDISLPLWLVQGGYPQQGVPMTAMWAHRGHLLWTSWSPATFCN